MMFEMWMRRACGVLIGVGVALSGAWAVEPTASVPKTNVKFKKTTVVGGLEHPWGLAFLPNGEMLVTERPGRVRLIRDGKLVEEKIKGVPEVYAVGQGGLLDISLHPKFEENNYVYLTYSAGTGKANSTRLGRGKLDLEAMELKDYKEIFQVEPLKEGNQHYGSVLEWLPDGTLLMSVGDGGNPPAKTVDGILARDQPQRLESHNGSVLRLNEDGSAPKDNPFVNEEGAQPEIWSYGHRNIQGMTRDPQSGRIWTNEHGPLGGDELNLTEAGKNYGWPKASFGREYGGGIVTPHTSLPGMVDPKIVWTPVTGASGLEFYTGDKFPEWKGALLSGGLVTQDVRIITLNGTEIKDQKAAMINRRVREVLQGPEGHIYVLTDHKDGELLRLEPE